MSSTIPTNNPHRQQELQPRTFLKNAAKDLLYSICMPANTVFRIAKCALGAHFYEKCAKKESYNLKERVVNLGKDLGRALTGLATPVIALALLINNLIGAIITKAGSQNHSRRAKVFHDELLGWIYGGRPAYRTREIYFEKIKEIATKYADNDSNTLKSGAPDAIKTAMKIAQDTSVSPEEIKRQYKLALQADLVDSEEE